MLPRTTQILQSLLPEGGPGPTLDVGSYQGTIAQESGCTYVHTDLTACNAARQQGVTTVIHTDILPEGPFGTICFDTSGYDPGLAVETLSQAAMRLAPGGVLLTTANKTDVAAVFATVLDQGEAVVARDPILPVPRLNWPSYDLTFAGHTFQIQSAPGVFSPRHLDEGTQLMLDQINAAPGAQFLDLGCGAGVVSRIAAAIWGCQVTAVDVNARALRLTAMNAPMATVIASDGFTGLAGRRFDLIASNPPYHTDFAVAKAFIEGAFSHLNVGGSLYLVVKRADWYVQKTRHVFGGCRLVEKDGYTVILAERRENRPRPATSEKTTTRKHAKRTAATRQHKPR